MPIDSASERTPFQKANWTPGSLRVLCTARYIALASNVSRHYLLLAWEVGDSVAAQTLRRLAISPSAALGLPLPRELSPEGEIYNDDFEPDLKQGFAQILPSEARSLGSWYLGSEHLILMLARMTVEGVELPYAQIRDTVRDLIKVV